MPEPIKPPVRPEVDIDLDAYEERAAIMEYDGGLSRDEAERHAVIFTRKPDAPVVK